MKLIIGLGNPGKEHAHTRHNVGWDAVSLAADKSGATGFHEKQDFKAEIAEAMMEGGKVLFVHPLTYMNASGDTVQAMKSFYKCANEDILIVHDEMDFPVGKISFAKQAGGAGHNGVLSIQERLATDMVPRLRLGISRPTPPIKKEDYVLQPFADQEKPIIQEQLTKSVDAIHDWITQGIDKAMNTWNGV